MAGWGSAVACGNNPRREQEKWAGHPAGQPAHHVTIQTSEVFLDL
jgi:hypothetical protein